MFRLFTSSKRNLALVRAAFFHKKTDQEMLTLKNGSKAHRIVVDTTMMTLKYLQKDTIHGVVSIYDLVELCKNPDHDISYSKKALLSLALIEEQKKQSTEKYTVHASIKNIVLSATEGKGLAITLISPVTLDSVDDNEQTSSALQKSVR